MKVRRAGKGRGEAEEVDKRGERRGEIRRGKRGRRGEEGSDQDRDCRG